MNLGILLQQTLGGFHRGYGGDLVNVHLVQVDERLVCAEEVLPHVTKMDLIVG
jgi:hypothetical protein